MPQTISLMDLPEVVNDIVYTAEKYPVLLDSTGQSFQFLKYRARVHSAMRMGDFDKEALRKGLLQCLHNGSWLCLDFGILDVDMEPLFDPDHFPEEVLSPYDLFLEDTLAPLQRDEDEFRAKITYEDTSANTVEGIQDRTKTHEAERVLDKDSSFEPKEGFRLIICTQKTEVPAALAEKLEVITVNVSSKQQEENAGVWGGGDAPKEKKTKEQLKKEDDLREFAFDGELEEVKKLLDAGVDSTAVDGRGNSALAEAATGTGEGCPEVVKYLLEWNPPLGSDPNAQGNDGRTPLHRAAFHGHLGTVTLLLESGADPRIKDNQNDLPFDICSESAVQDFMTAWDIEKTDELLAKRKAAIDAQEESLVQNAEDRKKLEKRRQTTTLMAAAKKGDKDELMGEVVSLPGDAGNLSTFRDDRGNTVLHITAWNDRLEATQYLVEEENLSVDLRESKGWTPLMIAAFHGNKKICQYLVSKGANPHAQNAYKKSVIDVAKDDEIKGVLVSSLDQDIAPAAEEGDGGEPKAKAKAKAKGKAKAKAGSKSKAKDILLGKK